MSAEGIKIQTIFNEHESSTEGETERTAKGVRLSGDITLQNTYVTAQDNEFSSADGCITVMNNPVSLEGGANKVIDIGLIDENGELIPREKFLSESKHWNYFIKIKATSPFSYHLSTTEFGWKLICTPPSACSKPVICDKLPKKWFMLPVRILLLSVEWPWYIVKSFWWGVMLTLKAIGCNIYLSLIEPENTSVTVGDEEE